MEKCACRSANCHLLIESSHFKWAIRLRRDEHSIPEEALGSPNYSDAVDDDYLTLGCSGELVVQFVDNALGDVDGPDIFVFEIGPAVETTHLAISKDADTWLDVGRISGGVASIDIRGTANPFDTYSYLKLSDGGAACFGEWPGADIDAIAAIGAGRRVVLDASLLFDVGESVLKPVAENALRELATEIHAIPNARVVIEGHTDNDGTEAYNQGLSEARAESVRRFPDRVPAALTRPLCSRWVMVSCSRLRRTTRHRTRPGTAVSRL